MKVEVYKHVEVEVPQSEFKLEYLMMFMKMPQTSIQ